MIGKALATVRSYADLHAALRARSHALRLVLGHHHGAGKSLDEVLGLPDGYALKLLAPVPIRRLGAASLGPMLAALGVALLLVEDTETLERITRRLKKRAHTNGGIRTMKGRRKRRYPKLGPEWGRMMRARSLLMQSDHKRRAMARKAIRARWSKPRKTKPP